MKASTPFSNTQTVIAMMMAAQLSGMIALSGELDLDPKSRAVTGYLTSISHIQFVGNETFSDETLRRALRMDLETVVAIQPESSLTECQRTLERRLLAGYRHAGFPDAEIRAEIDPAHNGLVLRIAEGARFYCGEVRINGLKTLDAEAVKARIISSLASEAFSNRVASPLVSDSRTNAGSKISPNFLSSSDSPILITNRSQVAELPLGIWDPGKPAPTDSAARRSLAEAVTDVFANLGYFRTRFALDLARPAAESSALQSAISGGHHTIDLVATVSEEGPPCTIGEIEVTGLRNNSNAAFLRWLGLVSGQRWTRELESEKRDQFIESGRFTVAKFEPGIPDDAGKIKLRVNVVELDIAPPLTAELSPNDEALQRLRRWLEDWPKRNEDAVLRLEAIGAAGSDKPRAELIASPGGGLFVRVNRTNQSAPPVWVFFVQTNVVSLVNGARREGLCSINRRGSLNLNIQVGVDPDGAGNFGFFFGFSSRTDAPPFQLKLLLEPTAFIKLARMPECRWQNQGSILTGTSSNVLLRVDARSGRLMELRFCEESNPETKKFLSGFSAAESQIVLSFKTNALNRAISDAAIATAGFTNRYEPRRRWGSILAFVASEALRAPGFAQLLSTNFTPERVAAAGSAFEKLLKADLFSGWDRILNSTNSDADAAFVIPPDDSSSSSGNNPLDGIAALVLGNRVELVSSDSWLGPVICGKALALSRRADLAGKEWERLFTSSETGPLACLVAARNVNSAGARAFGIRGLTQLSAQDFLTDCRTLLEGDGAVPTTVRKLLSHLRTLDDAEVESLASMLSKPDGDALRDAWRILREPNATPTFAALSPVLERWWAASLRARIAAGLRHQISGAAAARLVP